MKALLANRFAPLTFQWSFIEAPLERAAKDFQYIQERYADVTSRLISGSLPTLLSHLEPLEVSPSRFLLIETLSAWTAMFNNDFRGGEHATKIMLLSEKTDTRGLVIYVAPNTLTSMYKRKEERKNNGVYGAIGFELYLPDSQEWLRRERGVLAMNDGGRWKFEELGNPQLFEKCDQYSKTRIRDRMTADMLEEYCSALGIRLFDEEFYGPKAIVVECKYFHPNSAPSMSLLQVQRDIGFAE